MSSDYWVIAADGEPLRLLSYKIVDVERRKMMANGCTVFDYTRRGNAGDGECTVWSPMGHTPVEVLANKRDIKWIVGSCHRKGMRCAFIVPFNGNVLSHQVLYAERQRTS